VDNLLLEKVTKNICLNNRSIFKRALGAVFSTYSKDHVGAGIPSKAFLNLELVNRHSHPNNMGDDV
jgi:hypothetical protein